MKPIQTAPSAQDILFLNGVSFCYPENNQPILRNITLALSQGERVGIIGGNGCGKSTLSKLILGIFAPLEGNIEVFGQSVKWTRHLTQMGYVGDPGHNTQELGLPTWLSVREITSVIKELHRIEGRDVNDTELLENLGLVPLLERKIAHLSTGERKRLMVYLTFLHPPTFLILDEPFDGLDQNIIKYVKTLLEKALAQSELTLFFISHNQIEIDTYTDRVYQISDSKLIPVPQQFYTGRLAINGQKDIDLSGKTGQIMGTIMDTLKSSEPKEGLSINLKSVPSP